MQTATLLPQESWLETTVHAGNGIISALLVVVRAEQVDVLQFKVFDIEIGVYHSAVCDALMT